MVSVIKLVLFCLSNVGFWEIIRRKSKIHIYFLPSLTIAMETTLLFIAGLLNCLPEMTYILYLTGFIGLGYFVSKDRGLFFLNNYLKIGFVFLAVVCGIMLILLKGKIFASYDNFSHWALVVKTMLGTDRFPNFKDSIIMFTEYPLGSASYIYFFSKVISTSESIQMLAQVYMMISCMIPLFVFVKKNALAAVAVILSAVNFILTYNITVTNLLVDTLLPLVGMCGFLFAYLNCWKSTDKFHFFEASLYMIQLIQIKNSGVFFSALISILLLISMVKNRRFGLRIIGVLLPYISLFLWQKHCSYVFIGSEASKHAMTAENYKAVFGMKTVDEIRTICVSMLKFALTWRDVWITAAFILLSGVLVCFLAKEIKKTFFGFTILSCVMYLVYQIGMLAMYLFSMPVGEATSLASVERYTKTILIAILYLLLITIIQMISGIQRKKVYIPTAVIMFVSFLGFMYLSTGAIRIPLDYEEDTSEREWIETAKKDYDIPAGKSYCILIPQEDAGYAYYLGKYIFQSHDVSAFVVDSVEKLNGITAEYVFIYDQENEIVDGWIQEKYPDQYGNRVILRGDEQWQGK